MSKAILAALPIKPFGVAKQRLSERLDAATRSRVGKAIAERTAAAATDAGALVAIVTGDPGVKRWAEGLGYLTIAEPDLPRAGLDGAAEAAIFEATRRQRPWAIIHADLPLVTPAVLHEVFRAAEQGTVLVPSYDGGTNVVGGRGAMFRFAYGKASFHRHLAMNPSAQVLTKPQLALDLDTTDDLDRVLESGGWLSTFVR
ncbi:MAG: 2-phospho-L-lactate guanylyltransferase [bacterium]|nr:2-phospho-L-lactate guanylyltransferase [bacterium]